MRTTNTSIKPGRDIYTLKYVRLPVVVVVVASHRCCCSHINSHNKVRGHRTGSSHSGAEEHPSEKSQTNQRWYTHVSQLTQFMPPPETYQSEIRSQPTMCQTHTGAYVSQLAPGKNDYTACHPRKTTTYIYFTYHSTYHYAYARQYVNWKKEDKGKERR